MTYQIESFDFQRMPPAALSQCLRNYNISLTPQEACTLQKDILHRPPTLAECILWSIQGSEHCSYRSSRVHLKTLPTQGSEVILGAKEDAGVVRLTTDENGRGYGLVISHESHNHPSQIVPFEGAATGVGGNVRDVSCMGAEVIGNADMLRFGDIHQQKTHWIADGVVAGIASYSNSLGIPNVTGDVYFDDAYNDNCLVTVVTIGILPEDAIVHSYAPANADGFDLILVGKPTDMSGFGGASFASVELQEDKKEQNRGAVQEPNAFLERHLLKANSRLFAQLAKDNLLSTVGFKDLGAGGIACASVELADAAGYGADVFLDEVFVSQTGLHPSVILCSETQERFMWVVPPALTPQILKHYNETFALPSVSKGAQGKVIGRIRQDGRYRVHYQNQIIVDAKACDVTKGIHTKREYTPPRQNFNEPNLPQPKAAHDGYNTLLLKMLAHADCASRHPISERYDKQVQGRTILEREESCAGVLAPYNDFISPVEIQTTGVALAVAHYPRINKISPYWGAMHAVLQAMRKIVATGARPLALTDCLCFGDPEKPEQMWEFTEAVRGIRDACHKIKAFTPVDEPFPVIAGNVSLYNESNQKAVPASPLISCVGHLPNAHLALRNTFAQTDSLILLVGLAQDECGGSLYYKLHQALGANVPQANGKRARLEMDFVLWCHQQGYLRSANVIEAGGLAVCLAKMCCAKPATSIYSAQRIGCQVEVRNSLAQDIVLFSESPGFVLEVARDAQVAIETHLEELLIPANFIGHTTADAHIKINSMISIPTPKARQAWYQGLAAQLL